MTTLINVRPRHVYSLTIAGVPTTEKCLLWDHAEAQHDAENVSPTVYLANDRLFELEMLRYRSNVKRPLKKALMSMLPTLRS